MLTCADMAAALRRFDIPPAAPVIVHTSLSAFGHVQDGAETVVAALLDRFHSVVMPTFTYKTMVIPEVGPPGNGLIYGAGSRNRMAEIFDPQMPADRLMGVTAETLRRHPRALRSTHPILSFAGVGAGAILQAQTLAEPLAPIRRMAERQGWVLLMGVDHTVNTSVHLGERLAGRPQFVRWALTPQGVKECPGFPGCSDGFEALVPHLEGLLQRVMVGPALVQAVPLVPLLSIVQRLIQADPLALLCDRSYCDRCPATRERVSGMSS